MSNYRKKPVTIEAFQWTGGPDQTEDPAWASAAVADGTITFTKVAGETRMRIKTLEGELFAHPGDFIIKGVKDELYPCRADIFAATYISADAHGTPTMTFGEAIAALKAGKKVARAGWNGKGMWLVLMPALYLPPFNTQGTDRKVNDRTAKWIGEDKPLDCQPYIAMWTAQQKWQPGWLASQADMLAEDWTVID